MGRSGRSGRIGNVSQPSKHQPPTINHQTPTINHQTTTIHPSQSDPNLSFPKLVGSSKLTPSSSVPPSTATYPLHAARHWVALKFNMHMPMVCGVQVSCQYNAATAFWLLLGRTALMAVFKQAAPHFNNEGPVCGTWC